MEREFEVEVSTLDADSFFGRIIRVKAETIAEAMKKAKSKMERNETISQVCTTVEGCELPQPVWDYMNGNFSHHFGLTL